MSQRWQPAVDTFPIHGAISAIVGTGFETEGCGMEHADVLAMIHRHPGHTWKDSEGSRHRGCGERVVLYGCLMMLDAR